MIEAKHSNVAKERLLLKSVWVVHSRNSSHVVEKEGKLLSVTTEGVRMHSWL